MSLSGFGFLFPLLRDDLSASLRLPESRPSDYPRIQRKLQWEGASLRASGPYDDHDCSSMMLPSGSVT